MQSPVPGVPAGRGQVPADAAVSPAGRLGLGLVAVGTVVGVVLMVVGRWMTDSEAGSVVPDPAVAPPGAEVAVVVPFGQLV